jgi:CMP-N-acetylneuraminic acid synthetase
MSSTPNMSDIAQYQKKRITVAIIPARSKSKGIPRKNIAMVNHLPLIAYTIIAAREAIGIDKAIVSTDSSEIAELARQFGAETPFLRPASISGDRSSLSDTLVHTVAFLEKSVPHICDPIVTLLPTNPLRNATMIDEALDLFHETNADVVQSYHPVSEKAEDFCFLDTSGSKIELNKAVHDKTNRNQDPLYMANGAINIATKDRIQIIANNRTRSLKDRKTVAYIMNPLAGMDINTPDDLYRAEAQLRYLEVHGITLDSSAQINPIDQVQSKVRCAG